MKICFYCNIEKEKSDFYSNNICMKCVTEQNGNKRCEKCNIDKPMTDYYRKPNGRDGHSCVCKVCDLAKKKNVYKETKAKSNTLILNNTNLCKEFVEDEIIKTDLYKDKLSSTLLYKLYIIYVNKKGLKYNMQQPYFLEQMIQTNLLGDYEYAGFHYCKLKNDNV